MSGWRALSPAVARVSPREAIRAGVGASVGIGLAGLLGFAPRVDADLGLYLVAPFGATSVLLFAVPNAPLAQPWSAVVGNTLAALVGVASVRFIPDPLLRIALAVGLSILVTILARAVHPPAGAVAMTAAMSPDAIAHLGYWFALVPVAAGTLLLVLVAMVYARLTGRRYPYRTLESPPVTAGQPPPETRALGLSEAELEGILQGTRQGFNLGVADLARLVGAAELQAATHGMGPLAAEDIMSRDLITIGPDTSLPEIAALFRRHRFTSLPVVGSENRYLGVIFQHHLIARAGEDALRLNRGFGPALRRLLDPRREQPVTAADIMAVASARASRRTPIGALLPMMAQGDIDAVPVLERGRILGIVTRTDMIAALAHEAVRAR